MVQEASLVAEPRRFATKRARVGGLFAFLTGMLLIAIALHFAARYLVFNITDSMPIGLYGVKPLGATAVKAGDIVRICASPEVARFGVTRGYVPGAGSCPFETAPLLKIVVAVNGDTVIATPESIVVAGHSLRNSATASRDSAGRPLPSIARGTYVLKPGQLWLWTPNPKSWDSRYYGPLDLRDVSGTATLLFAVQNWPFAVTEAAHT